MLKITTAFGIGPLRHVKGGGYLENFMWPRTIKTILRCKERPLEDIENSKFCPYGADLVGSLIIYVTH